MVWRLALVGLLFCIGSPEALAGNKSACARFKWSIARELALFAAPTPLGDDDWLQIGKAGYRTKLVDYEALSYSATPAHARKPGTHGVALALVVRTGGVYDFTLSDEGWIDVVDHGVIVPPIDFSDQKGCIGVRTSVRFRLKTGEYTVQLSNIDGEEINIAIVPAW